MLADSADRQDRLSGIDAEDTQSPPVKGLARDIELLEKRKRVIQGDTPGIHVRLQVGAPDGSGVLSMCVVSAQPDGKIAVVTGAFCFSALGVAVSTFVPNEDAAPAIINFVLFPLLFISGTFGPISSDSMLSKIATVFPMQHLNRLMVRVFNPFAAGTAIHSTDVAILILWAVIGATVAARRFRWEPART